MESIIIQKLHHVDDRIDIDESNLTPIQEFYKDAKVFVTGFTGFIGQILVEKLLRSCPVSTIYVLMRQKKGKDIDVRLQEIFDDHVFSRMKKACPGFRQKVVAMEGDCNLPDLGLSDEDKKVLIDGVSIVFHIAATVRFEEKLKTAVIANIRATRDLTLLARQMSHLKSFVYVSTAYANCFQDVIEERICPANIDYHKLIVMSETIEGFLLEKLSSDFRGKHANTYTYTKQIAENVVKTEMQGLPAVVYRPAIVLSTFKEPIRGWCNNLYGATGIFYAASLGILRVVRCDQDKYANIIPADMCVNGMIASAWDGKKRFQEAKDENGIFELPVYNYESINDQSSW
ncbi:fatty acyl-CoA reductase wat-like [Anoplophora glabripennis]|uniref:fatty acyl-CoA reductase wat-like n=1 Tax=Anoplophora glabripennis TaxID=217634 RepID=UPI0008750244|nr:fatty acyl-CoA reductase wat-like [Anoplophora glabripennis]